MSDLAEYFAGRGARSCPPGGQAATDAEAQSIACAFVPAQQVDLGTYHSPGESAMSRQLAATALLGILALSGVQAAGSEKPLTFHPRGDDAIHLQGLLHAPSGAGEFFPGVVICHPDPRYGGSLSSHVVTAVQGACSEMGWATLRFNFRGVDRSGGVFDDGKGELADCLGALDALRSTPRVDPARVALVGYSFGSWVGLRAAVSDGHVPACVCLSFPVPAEEDIARHGYFADIRCPVLLLTGTEDSISWLPTIEAIVAGNQRSDYCRVVALEGADHFYSNPADLAAARRATTTFLHRLLMPAT